MCVVCCNVNGQAMISVNTNTLYRNRKLKVQEDIKRKEQVFQMINVLTPKNKMKGFWNVIKGHNYVNSPSQVFNPENH
jgi:hypothetical protein